MKILTNKQLTKIEVQTVNKIYNALNELHEKDNSNESGIVKDRHEELLDIALNHLALPATEDVYGWIRCSTNFKKYFNL